MTAGQHGGWTIKLVLIWLTYLYALLCIAFIVDLIPILHLSGFCRRFCRAARQICFNQSEALPRSGQWHVISMEFLHPFFRRQFGGEIVGGFAKCRLFSLSLLFIIISGGSRGGARRARPPPIIFDQNEAERAKKFFWSPPPPSPLIWRSGLATDYCIYFFCESLQETIMNITEVSEAAITVRGTFFPPGINKSDVFLS